MGKKEFITSPKMLKIDGHMLSEKYIHSKFNNKSIFSLFKNGIAFIGAAILNVEPVNIKNWGIMIKISLLVVPLGIIKNRIIKS